MNSVNLNYVLCVVFIGRNVNSSYHLSFVSVCNYFCGMLWDSAVNKKPGQQTCITAVLT